MTASREENPVLNEYPYPHSNVFLMMRFRKSKQHQEISEAVQSMLAEYSLNLIRADMKDWQEEKWENIRSCMDASHYGIAVFEQIDERDINPNVSLELGYMLAQGKKCLLLKEQRVPALQGDLVGHLYHGFDSYDIRETVRNEVQRWLRDLGIAKSPNERMLVYVSLGGTCRCAIAKVITEKLLEENPPGYTLRVESRAHGQLGTAWASNGARHSIQKMLGEDLLSDHVAQGLSPAVLREADLILVMEESLRKGLPEEKTRVFKPYFGLQGDILNPWPDDDEGAAKRYAQCATELREILTANIGKIIEAMKPH